MAVSKWYRLVWKRAWRDTQRWAREYLRSEASLLGATVVIAFVATEGSALERILAGSFTGLAAFLLGAVFLFVFHLGRAPAHIYDGQERLRRAYKRRSAERIRERDLEVDQLEKQVERLESYEHEILLEMGGLALTQHKETGHVTVFVTDMVLTNPSATRMAVELWIEISNRGDWTTATTAKERRPPDVSLESDYFGRIVNIDGTTALSGFSAFDLEPSWIAQAGATNVQDFIDRVPLFVIVKDKITNREKKFPAPGTIRKEFERQHQAAAADNAGSESATMS